MNKIASMTQNAYGKAICPVHTTADGDSIYAMSIGDIIADINVVGTLAVRVMEQAIMNAIKHTRPCYGLKASSNFIG